MPVKDRIWTRNKALLIDRYLYYFLKVTKHGTYIDGFAGPQEQTWSEAWSARRVVESQPTPETNKVRLRHFHLFDLEESQVQHLDRLRDEHPEMDIVVHSGDFNMIVDEILDDNVIGPTEAVFSLLDQRAFECHWATIEKLATYQPKRQYRFELFYFLANWWVPRSKDLGEAKGKAWWGRGDYQIWLEEPNGMKRAEMMVDRFRDFDYGSVTPWPIYSSETGPKVAYFMIHATDHPRAPILMRTAYEDAVRAPLPVDQLALDLGMNPSELAD